MLLVYSLFTSYLTNTMKHYSLFLLALCVLGLNACTTLNGPAAENDPLESYNRSIYKFNDGVDHYLLKPVAKGYDAVTPDFAQQGIGNFFNNLDDVLVIANDLLQFKLLQAAQDTGRFVVNSTLGLLGFIDWASDIGLEKHHEDFGQTLGVWGVPAGPYFMLPFLGPSTIRDTGGLTADSTYFNPVYKELNKGFPPPSRSSKKAVWGMVALDTVDSRAKLLKAEAILEEAALDKYSFIREAYLQKRKNLVFDGAPPEDDGGFSEDDLFSE